MNLVLQGSSCNLDGIKSIKINCRKLPICHMTRMIKILPILHILIGQDITVTNKVTFVILFHSRNTKLLDSSDTPSLQVEVKDDKGQCYQGNVKLTVKPGVTVTYATTANQGLDFIVHFSGSGTLNNYAINGVATTGKPITVSSNHTTIVSFKQSIAMTPGRVGQLPMTIRWDMVDVSFQKDFQSKHGQIAMIVQYLVQKTTKKIMMINR